MTTTPLETLAQQIEQQQSHLEILRQEYQDRQAKLDELNRRKQELQDQLRGLEAEIAAVSQGGTKPTAAPPPKPVAKKPSAPAPKSPRSPAPALADLLVKLVRAGGGQPVTVKNLAEEVVRRKFPTSSGNIPGLVSTKVGDLVKRGIFRRDPNQHGVLLVTAENGKAPASPKAAPRAQANGKPQTTHAKATQKSKAGQDKSQPTLREVLTTLLKKSGKPLARGELARQALAGGYRSGSGDFPGVVSVTLAQMPNVENVAGKGYRLKKGKG